MICLDTRVYYKNRALIGRDRMYTLLNALAKSAVLDEVNIRGIDAHDKIFKPKNVYEKRLWVKSRTLTKNSALKLYLQIKGGKKGGRPKKIIDSE